MTSFRVSAPSKATRVPGEGRASDSQCPRQHRPRGEQRPWPDRWTLARQGVCLLARETPTGHADTGGLLTGLQLWAQGGGGRREAPGGAITQRLASCVPSVPAQHALLADILPRRPGGAAARPGAGVSIAGPPASPPATPGASHPPGALASPASAPDAGPRAPRPRGRAWRPSQKPSLQSTWVLRRRVPGRGLGIFNFGGKGRLGVRAFPQDSTEQKRLIADLGEGWR